MQTLLNPLVFAMKGKLSVETINVFISNCKYIYFCYRFWAFKHKSLWRLNHVYSQSKQSFDKLQLDPFS